MEHRFLSAAELAQLFKLNVETVHALIAEGQLPGTDSEVSKGASFLIRPADGGPSCGRRGCRMRRIT